MNLKTLILKSGKSSRPLRENWSMLYIAESDEGDVESTESRDASSFEEDVEISSFEKSSNFDLGFHRIMRRARKVVASFFTMTSDPLTIDRAAMGTKLKITFTARREA